MEMRHPQEQEAVPALRARWMLVLGLGGGTRV